ncbi:hypothetical protein [Pseudoruegeria sp. SHC-113]|uniref:hypothetical protein n=1 Tax=Pseudoruegeria sp. SHC-113 TaxID=2855439 RepID=UPI0021BB04FF|nr:hypothetical protein [Pseudoruegeria sp. SHC-113]MCT8161450.1 hypothetical protein [Pseudoruegeria sp. SHC-113]
MSDVKTAGYSGKPLFQKLGFKPGFRVGLRAAPAHYPDLLAGAEGVDFVDEGGALDAVHLFLHGPEGIASAAAAALADLREGGMLWISWPKKPSKLFCGVTEDDLRTAVLPLGWVDVKVCAVDADWSGLKFLKRKAAGRR